MNASIQPFAIGETSIRQHDGLFSLNDLHKASGSIESQRPNQFLRIDQTKALIQELETAQICAVKTKEGRNGGTYACRELVIAYAAWISAAFHLKVIRVFLDVAAPAQPAKLTPADKQTIREAVARKAGRDGEAYQSIYNAMHAHFHVNSYHELPAGSLQEALAVVDAFEAKALPAPQEAPSLARRRWLVWFDHKGQERHMALADRDCIFQWADVPRHIESGSVFDADLIARIGQACFARLLEMQQASSSAAQRLRQQAKRQPPALA